MGLSGAGLYQVNIVVPDGLGDGDFPIRAMVGGMETQQGVLFPVVPGGTPIFTGTAGGITGGGPFPGYYFMGPTTWGFGPGTGTGTGGFGGSGGPGTGTGGFGSGGTGGGGAGGAVELAAVAERRRWRNGRGWWNAAAAPLSSSP